TNRADADEALIDAGDEGDAGELADAKQAELGQLRERADQARLKLGSFETAARMRDSRLAQLDKDSASWQRRREGAMAQLATLDSRTAEVSARLANVNET